VISASNRAWIYASAQLLLETEQKLKARGIAALQNHRDKYAKANASHAVPRGGGAGVEGDLPRQAEQKAQEAAGSESLSNSFPGAAIHSG
jgi:hypothetical protein